MVEASGSTGLLGGSSRRRDSAVYVCECYEISRLRFHPNVYINTMLGFEQRRKYVRRRKTEPIKVGHG